MAGPRNEWPLWEVFVRSRRGLSHVHSGSLHAPDAEMALRNARDLYTRRQEGVSIWVVPVGRHRGQHPRRARLVLRPGRRQDLPAPDVLRRPRGGRAPVSTNPLVDYVLGLADDALISAQRMGWWISRAPQLEEDVALANIGLDQLGQARTLLAYAGEVEGDGRERGRPRLPPRRARLPQRQARRARPDRLRRRHGPAAGVRPPGRPSCTPPSRAAPTAPSPGSPARPSRRSPTTSTTPTSGCCASATAPTSRTPACRRPSTPSGRTSTSSSTPRPSTPAWSPTASRSIRRTLREPVLARITAVVEHATLSVPEVVPAVGGGRRGLHTEEMGYLLAEMQHLTRSHPGVTW